MAIYDICKLSSCPVKRTLVLDTNIIMWMYSGYPIQKNIVTKVKQYSSFLGKAFSNGCNLVTTVANVQEGFHIIERAEFEIEQKKCPSKYRNIKVFRSDSTKRIQVKNKLISFLSVIKSNITICDSFFTTRKLDDFVSRFDSHLYDPIDYFVVEDQITNHCSFVTHDSDYYSDSRIDVFTVR